MPSFSKRSVQAAALAALLIASGAPLAAQTSAVYTIDPGHSSALFATKHLVISVVRGTIPIKEGIVTTDGATTAPATIAATLDAAGINSQNDNRDSELRGPDWLDVQKYPTIVFKSTSITNAPDGSFKALGNLTLHGVTKPVELDGKLVGSTVDGRGKQHIGYSATTTIDRTAFGMNFMRTTPGGGLIAGTSVDISLDVEVVAH
jgi:polyisoprenoid-binding protein YceI